LIWRGHEIKGKDSYIKPWRRITTLANQIAGTIAHRFPSEEFLKALDVVDPREWGAARDPSFAASILSI
jgi:hypothetical protein